MPLLLLATVMVAGCGDGQGEDATAYQQRIEDIAQAPLKPTRTAQEKALDDAVFAIASPFDGYLGVAIHDVERGRTVQFNGDLLFPQQSLSKLWVTLTALQKVDAGDMDLGEAVSVGVRDLTVFHQPLRQIVLRQGAFHTNYADLMRRAITESDNTANDLLLKRVGGPDAVRDSIAGARLGSIRFGPGEIAMQSGIAAMEWRPSYSYGERFFEARKRVPADERKAAFDAYVEDPVDGASPRAVASALARLAKGELLGKATTTHFLGLLEKVKSGPNRLKGGVPAGWSIGHKTGTGQVLDTVPRGVIGEQAGYNDVGILTAPDGHRYTIAVMIGRTRVPVPERMDMMHRIVRAVVAYHYAAKGEPVPEGLLPPEDVTDA
ncbi:serine hydrolase [Parerythrobacter aestuarii]|uniref:serine hydrolase n=1 Tax=Parerythrobacter aestuarii TaxID=3020909 RepID=UPI0024DE605B|nr:serine hydrolase [Parerythrobacter aestuarii]